MKLDILILHGEDDGLVKEIQTYLRESFELNVSTVKELPANGLSQLDKVKCYINDSKFILILATFYNKTNVVKPNVAQEIQLCLDSGNNNYLIAREERNGATVDIGSNLDKRTSEILFDRKSMIKLFTKINQQLTAFKVLFIKDFSDFSEYKSDANQLNEFLDKMDVIWEEEFDIASELIERDDWKTEKEFQNKLDAFFLKYWNVFNAIIRKEVKGDKLLELCSENLDDAFVLAFEVWHLVVKSRLVVLENEQISDINLSKSNNCDKIAVDNIHKILEGLNKHGNKRAIKNSYQEKIKIIKELNTRIENCLK